MLLSFPGAASFVYPPKKSSNEMVPLLAKLTAASRSPSRKLLIPLFFPPSGAADLRLLRSGFSRGQVQF